MTASNMIPPFRRNGSTAFDWANFDPNTIPGLRLWYRADKLITLSSGVSAWGNNGSTGSAADLSQSTSARRPSYTSSNASFGGRPTVDFASASTQYMSTTGAPTGLSSVEAFLVLNLVADPPASATNAGLWYYSTTSAGSLTYYPFTDGVIYDASLTSARKTTVNPTPSLTSAHLYNVVSTSSEWTSFLNGTQLFTTATNTVGLSATAIVGTSHPSLTNTYLNGSIAEIAVYDNKISSGDKTNFKRYIAARYGITVV